MSRITLSLFTALTVLGLLAAGIAKPADAQTQAQTWQKFSTDISANTTMILSGNPNGTLTAASSLTAAN